MGGHAEPPTSPSDDLHRGGVRNQVLQFATALVQQARLEVLLLVMLVEDLLHGHPKSFLPFEHCLLGHDVRHDAGLEASREKVMRQVWDVVHRVVVRHHRIAIVSDRARIDLNPPIDLALRVEQGFQHAVADHAVASAVLAPDGVALEEHGPFEAKLNAVDVDGVAADCNAIPAATHGAVGRAQGLFEAHGLALLRRRRDSRLLEDGADARSRRHGVVQHLVVGCVTMLARKVEVLPLPRVHEGLDPLVPDQIHRVVSHLFASDEDHGRCQDLARRGAQRPHRRAQARKARRGKDHA
mmetsp:Transcript_7123/g.17817  ORF Transcript_7123/g.17817 Transcript_7123/m.17817 type:complete len:297 (-) Transcript_7123:88-978(-)